MSSDDHSRGRALSSTFSLFVYTPCIFICHTNFIKNIDLGRVAFETGRDKVPTTASVSSEFCRAQYF